MINLASLRQSHLRRFVRVIRWDIKVEGIFCALPKARIRRDLDGEAGEIIWVGEYGLCNIPTIELSNISLNADFTRSTLLSSRLRILVFLEPIEDGHLLRSCFTSLTGGWCR